MKNIYIVMVLLDMQIGEINMYKIRQGIFETNSSSSDYYREPDYVDYSTLTDFPTYFEATFEADDFGKIFLKYLADGRGDFIEVLQNAMEFWEPKVDFFELKDEVILYVGYYCNIDIQIEGKYNGPSYWHITGTSALNEETDSKEIDEFKEKLIKEMIDYVDNTKEDVADSFNISIEELDEKIEKMTLKIIKLEIPEITKEDVDDFYNE